MNTWGKRCNKLIFFTETEHQGYPTVELGIPDTGSNNLTYKMFVPMKYLHDHHLNDFDWFIKADTDTYLIVENLRYMLSGHQPTEPIFFGQHFKVGTYTSLFLDLKKMPIDSIKNRKSALSTGNHKTDNLTQVYIFSKLLWLLIIFA